MEQIHTDDAVTKYDRGIIIKRTSVTIMKPPTVALFFTIKKGKQKNRQIKSKIPQQINVC